MKKLILSLSFIIFTALQLSAQSFWFKGDISWWKNRNETTGVVTKVNKMPCGVACEFTVKGKKYNTNYAFFDSPKACEGMKFRVAYNPKNPEENHVVLYKPVLDIEKESIGYAMAKIQRKGVEIEYMEDLKMEIATIYYDFEDDDGKLHKDLVFYTKNPKGWTEKNYYEGDLLVCFWTKNARRAVIDLDQTYQSLMREQKEEIDAKVIARFGHPSYPNPNVGSDIESSPLKSGNGSGLGNMVGVKPTLELLESLIKKDE